MRYEPFVLDFDSTYDIPDSEIDMFPVVYFIPEGMSTKVEQIADLASETFHLIEDDRCIGDIFEDLLTENQIAFLLVGNLKIPFEDRQRDYLTDAVCYAVV